MRWWLIALALAQRAAPMGTATQSLMPQATLHKRQESETETTRMPLFPTPTTGHSTQSSYSIWETTYIPLTVASTVPVEPSMGLIVPQAYPYKGIYVGVAYQMGWVEIAPIYPQIAGGWMREVSPAVILPDYSMLPVNGSDDPRDDYYYPHGPGICGSYVSNNWINSYPFTITQAGWHMLVVNQTWMKPTITNGSCYAPFEDERSFFATHVFSVSEMPTNGVIPLPPFRASTTWVRVTTQTPGSLPYQPHTLSHGERIAVIVGATLGVVAAIVAVIGMFWLKRRRFIKAERTAFERMTAEQQREFLAANPNSLLNPDRPTKGFLLSPCVGGARNDINDPRQEKAQQRRRNMPYPPGPGLRHQHMAPMHHDVRQSFPRPGYQGWHPPMASFPTYGPHDDTAAYAYHQGTPWGYGPYAADGAGGYGFDPMRSGWQPATAPSGMRF